MLHHATDHDEMEVKMISGGVFRESCQAITGKAFGRLHDHVVLVVDCEQHWGFVILLTLLLHLRFPKNAHQEGQVGILLGEKFKIALRSHVLQKLLGRSTQIPGSQIRNL